MPSIKENLIREYILNTDWKSDWKLSHIKEDLRKFLGEEPGIDIIYKKDVMLNEATQLPEEVHELEKVLIVFTDTDDKFKKLEFSLGKL